VWDYGNQFEVHDFTQNYESVKRFIESTEADGGDDDAEDITGALKRGLHLDFSGDGMLLTFLIADSPTHGKQYHDGIVGDELENDVPVGSLEA